MVSRLQRISEASNTGACAASDVLALVAVAPHDFSILLSAWITYFVFLPLNISGDRILLLYFCAACAYLSWKVLFRGCMKQNCCFWAGSVHCLVCMPDILFAVGWFRHFYGESCWFCGCFPEASEILFKCAQGMRDILQDVLGCVFIHVCPRTHTYACTHMHALVSQACLYTPMYAL